MNDHLIAIEKSIQDKNYYSALFLAITLPSVCGALESVDGNDSKQRYIDWYKKYIKNLFLTGEDCYRLRCSLLHQASTLHQNSSFLRVIFTFPVSTGNTFHNNIPNNALNLDIPLFCKNLVDGANAWLVNMQNNTNYSNNVKNMIKIYPDGLPPFISGQPVIS